VVRARTDRRFSDHIFLSVISSSQRLCDDAFNTLVNSQMIAISRGSSRYLFSNFLYNAVEQLGGYLPELSEEPELSLLRQRAGGYCAVWGASEDG
jgi:hypothetical protein